MKVFLLLFTTSWSMLEYRFGLDYGDSFYDYSGNNNTGLNGLASDNTNVMKTDRGVYLTYDSSRVISKDYLPTTDTFFISFWFIPTNDGYRICFLYGRMDYRLIIARYSEYRSFYAFRRSEILQFNTEYQNDTAPLGTWSLVSFYYSNKTYTLFSNLFRYKSETADNFDTSLYKGGIGNPNNHNTLAKGFVWNFLIKSNFTDPQAFLSQSGICLAGSCHSSNYFFIDPALGNISLSNTSDPSKTSYGEFCTSCTKSIKFNCLSSDIICSYNPITNTCSTIDVLSLLNQTVDCLCNQNFVKINKQCCNNDCGSCDSFGDCLNCSSSNMVKVNLNCQCLEGFYKDFNQGSTIECLPCEFGCKKCSSQGACDVCADGLIKIIGKCECLDGFYKVFNQSSMIECLPCEVGCLKCSSQDTCNVCNDNLIKNNGKCECLDGFYKGFNQSSMIDCLSCEVGCKKCSSQDTCNVCNDNLILIHGKCECEDDFYKIFNQSSMIECLACEIGCLKCRSQGTCDVCAEDLQEINGKCECLDGFYRNLNQSSMIECLPCEDGCLKCSNQDTCDICNNSLKKIKGKCGCLDGFYKGFNQNSLIDCLPCEVGCFKCSSQGACDICNDNLIMVNGKCECEDGFYKIFNQSSMIECLVCEIGCLKCSNQDTCDICDNSLMKIKGKCGCLDGFYEGFNQNSLIDCLPCEAGCLKCSSQNSCNVCTNGLKKINGKCECEDGFYKTLHQSSMIECLPCQVGCSKCSSQNICNICTENSQKIKGNCECLSGFYLNSIQNNCISCHPSCSKCTETQCLKCLSSEATINSTFCKCRESFYETSENLCMPCYEDCSECEEAFKCSVCIADNSLPDSHKGCICEKGFWNSSSLTSKNSCKICNKTCESCFTENNCSSCKDPKAFLNEEGECLVYCSEKLKENCFKCNDLCEKCFKNMSCFQCSENSYLEEGKCLCFKGFERISESCLEKLFYWEISVKNNKILISFTEDVRNVTIFNYLTLEIESKTVSFFLKKVKQKVYYIVPYLNKEQLESSNFILEFKEVIYSEAGSRLFNSSFAGTFDKFNKSTEKYDPFFKAIANIASFALFAVVISSNPTALWALLNTIQFIVFLPLNSVDYPKKLKEISSSFIVYNILPNFFSFMFDNNSTSAPYYEASRFGYETSVFFINIGKNLGVLIIFLCFLALVGFLSKLFKNSVKIDKIWKMYQFNLIFDFWVQMYLELGVGAFIQLKSVRFMKRIILFVPGFTNYSFAVFICFLFALSPLILLAIIKKSLPHINNSEFMLKYRGMIRDLKKNDGLICIFYNPLQMTRKMIYVLTQIFLNKFPAIQLVFNTLCSTVFFIYLLYKRPFQDSLANISFILGELCILVVFCSTCPLAFEINANSVNLIENICTYSIYTAVGSQLLIGLICFGRQSVSWYKSINKKVTVSEILKENK